MTNASAPDEPGFFESIAAPIDSPEPVTPPSVAPASDRLLRELGRFLERVSVQGVSSPMDRAVLAGAKQIFQSMLDICDEVAEKAEPRDRGMRARHYEVAGYADWSEPDLELEPVGAKQAPKKKTASKRKTKSRRTRAKKKS